MLSVITLDEEEKWDEIVKSFDSYDVYYLAEYVKAFEVHGDGKPTLFYYKKNDFRAINVVIIRDIEKDENFSGQIKEKRYYDMITPYGYGGFLLEGEATSEQLKELNEKYISKCRQQGIVSELVRFHPVLDNSMPLGEMYDIVELGKTITMELESKSQVWSDIIGKNRNVIRKAIKSDVEIYWGRSKELLEEFKRLYKGTMDKDKAESYYYFNEEFFNSILNDLKYQSMIFYAVYEEEIISMSMILFANEQIHYHLSASNQKYQHLAPTNLLLYEAACWGCENDYTTFHLGGGLGSKEDSLYKFKRAFNRNSNSNFVIGKKIFNEEVYEELVEIRNREGEIDVESSFFPAYRI